MTAAAFPIATGHRATRFVNVYATSDAVIDVLAETFTPDGGGGAIGSDGLAPHRSPNRTDVVLDGLATQAWAASRGWTLCGDDPK